MTDASQDHEALSALEVEQLPISALMMISMAQRIDKASTAYGVEISAEKIKLMTNSTSGTNKQDQSKRTEAGDSHKLRVPGLRCI